jgi:hypothetical protein
VIAKEAKQTNGKMRFANEISKITRRVEAIQVRKPRRSGIYIKDRAFDPRVWRIPKTNNVKSRG